MRVFGMARETEAVTDSDRRIVSSASRDVVEDAAGCVRAGDDRSSATQRFEPRKTQVLPIKEIRSEIIEGDVCDRQPVLLQRHIIIAISAVDRKSTRLNSSH